MDEKHKKNIMVKLNVNIIYILYIYQIWNDIEMILNHISSSIAKKNSQDLWDPGCRIWCGTYRVQKTFKWEIHMGNGALVGGNPWEMEL